MISRELIDKINSLWHKQQTVGLTAEEKEEQRLAREEYLTAIRSQVRDILDSLNIPKKSSQKDHSPKCSCEDCRHQ